MMRAAGAAFVLFLTSAGASAAGAGATECAPGFLDLAAPGSEMRFQVEVADTEDERAEGLMFRESLGAREGMLFVYPQPVRRAFWMRNTPLPLDLIFFDSTGRVQHVHHNARPFDETLIDSGEGMQFVLEVNAGTARRLGVGPGARMRHPVIARDIAVWPCP